MGKKRYLVYAGLFLVVAFNYVDRVALSIGGPAIAKEFGLDPIQMGYLFSSYVWTYLLLLIPCGLLTDKYGAKVVNSVGVTVWSAATLMSGFAVGFWSLIASRLLMGGAEGSTFPAGAKALRDWSPKKEFGLASTMLNSGCYAGPALGTLILGWVISVSSWRWAFFSAAVLGFVWLLGWMRWYRKPEEADWLDAEERALIINERDNAAGQEAAPGGLAKLLRSKSMIAIALVHGCAAYTQYVFLTWLPSYLAISKNLSIVKSGVFTALPYFIAAVASWGLAHWSDRMLEKRGGASTGARRTIIVVSMLSAAVVLFTPLIDNVAIILVLVTISLTGLATGMSLNIALTADLLKSPENAGKAISIQLTGGNILGTLGPIATGYIISATGRYDMAFVVSGVLLALGAIVAMVFTRSNIG